jgi:hypothetical protein
MWWRRQAQQTPSGSPDGSEMFADPQLLQELEQLENCGWDQVVMRQPQLAATTLANMAQTIRMYMATLVQMHQNYSQLVAQLAQRSGEVERMAAEIRSMPSQPIVVQQNRSGLSFSDLLYMGLVAWGAHSVFKGTPLPGDYYK